MQNEPVWEHVDLLLNIGEYKGNKEEAECTAPRRLYVNTFLMVHIGKRRVYDL